MGNTITSFETLRDIYDHVVPQVEGADYEISAGMEIMHTITKTCVDRAIPMCDRYNVDRKIGHEVSELLRERPFPKDLLNVTGSSAFDVMRVLTSFYLFLPFIETLSFALLPAAQAAWDEEFVELVMFQTDQLERMKA